MEKKQIPKIAVKNYKGIEVERFKCVPSAANEELRLKDVIIDMILEANDIDVPQDMVDEEVAMMIVEHRHRMKYESMASGSYYDFLQDDLTDRMEAFREEAFKLVKTGLIFKGIIYAEGLEVTKGELEEEAKAMAARQQVPVEKVKDFLGEDMELLKKDLLIRKAVDFVYASAVII